MRPIRPIGLYGVKLLSKSAKSIFNGFKDIEIRKLKFVAIKCSVPSKNVLNIIYSYKCMKVCEAKYIDLVS